MTNRVRLAIPSGTEHLSLVDAVVTNFVVIHGGSPLQASELVNGVKGLVAWTIDVAYPSGAPGELVVQLEPVEGGVRCTIEDWGAPVAAFDQASVEVPAALQEIAGAVSELRMINLGHDGKRLSAVFPVQGFIAKLASIEVAHLRRGAPTSGEHAIPEVRGALPSDVEGISRLVFSIYGLSYVHENFYRPAWIAEQIADGSLLSTVAVVDGEVVGHHGLLSDQPRVAFESGVGVVHPIWQGIGVASSLAGLAVERAYQAGIPAIVARAVLIHPYSQRAEHAAGIRITGLLVGGVPIGVYGATKRGTTLLSYLPLTPHEHAVSIPSRYRAQLTAAFQNLGVEIAAADVNLARAEFGALPALEVQLGDELGSNGTCNITLGGWDDDARAKLIDTMRDAVRAKSDIVYCDVDLSSLTTPQLDEIVDLLRTYDFFYAGLVVYGRAGHDHLRMQAVLAPLDTIEVTDLVLDSDFAREVRQFVLSDHDQFSHLL